MTTKGYNELEHKILKSQKSITQKLTTKSKIIEFDMPVSTLPN